MATYNVLNYGAAGDGVTNDAAAIQKAIDICAETGGGCVLLPAGNIYYSGSIVLRSNVDFHVEIGACLKASGNLNDYIRTSPEGTTYEGRPIYAFIYAKDEHMVKISGEGAIDGNAPAFAGKATQYYIEGIGYPRPTLIFFENCNHISFTEITLQNSHFWTLHPAGCNDVFISGIRILNDLKMANSDGIDPDHCKNVRIVNCHIESADDCIVLKNTKAMGKYGATENVVITGCTLTSTSSAIKIGTEGVCNFRNIVVDSCVISKSNRGLSIQVRDSGNVENVRFSNISIETRRFHDNWWGKAEPIYVTAFDRDEATKSGKVRNISFQNISCTGENGVYISGWKGNPLEEIVLDNVRVEIVKSSKWEGGVYDRRPCALEGIVYENNAGIYCEYAQNVTLRYAKVVWDADMPAYYGPSLNTKNVDALKIEDFQGIGAHENKNIYSL